MKLGIVENVLGPGTERERFARAARMGLAGVEVVWASEDTPRPEERVRRLQAARQASGLAIPSLMLADHNRGGIASADPEVARRAVEDVRTAIGIARELGARVVLVPFFFAGELVGSRDMERAAAAFRLLCPEAERAGVQLAYEGTLPAEDIQTLAVQIASPAFGCYFDPGNAVWQGMDPDAEARALGALVRQVHLKDARIGPGDCRPGLGRVDWPLFARGLREGRYDGWLVLETPGGPLELVARDASFARWTFPELGPAGPLQLGIFSFEFGPGEERRLATVCQDLGLGAVQLGGALLDEALADEARAQTIRATLAGAGVGICALAGYRNLVAPDAARRRENLAYLRRCLELAPQMGTSVVATETGTRHPESDWLGVAENRGEATWHLLLEGLRELVEVAERHGSILAIEGFVNNVTHLCGDVLGMLEGVPSEHLQLVLDPYNYIGRALLKVKERALTDFLQRFEPHFVLAHAKDVSSQGAELDTPEFGTGVLPQRPYLEFWRSRRPELPLILEHLPLEHVPAAMARVRDILG